MTSGKYRNINKNNRFVRLFNVDKRKSFVYSVLIDVLGINSALLPAIGEFFGDVIVAPITGICIYLLHRKYRKFASIGAFAGFLEEAVPFTDIIPSALLNWYYTFHLNRSRTLRYYSSDEEYQLVEREKYLAREEQISWFAWVKDLLGF